MQNNSSAKNLCKPSHSQYQTSNQAYGDFDFKIVNPSKKPNQNNDAQSIAANLNEKKIVNTPQKRNIGSESKDFHQNPVQQDNSSEKRVSSRQDQFNKHALFVLQDHLKNCYSPINQEEQRLVTLESDVAKLQESVVNLQGSVANLQGSVANLQGSVVNLQDQLKSCNKKIDKIEKNISKMMEMMIQNQGQK